MQEQPRGVIFHWVANMLFAGIALFSGILFGLEVPKNLVLPIIVLGALTLIPVTRRWERSGIRNRQAQAAQAGEDRPGEPGSSS
ncbi:MAG TPA: hypothetical protein VHL54_06990 [Actinomycetota bacterium]|jgi:hypothetical protein|nr:hypothetical protein [Actinomycetota bacterium]